MQDLPLAGGVLAEPPEACRPLARGEDRVRSIVDAHFSFVWRSLCHLGIPEADAEDAAQQVFLIASSKIDIIEVGSEKAFLFGTALRVASRARRSYHRRRETAVAQDRESVDASPTPEDLVDRARARVLLDEALDAMEPEVRAVFVLFEIEQLSKSEVAAALGIPAGTVASRVRRGRDEFRDHIRRFQARPRIRGGTP
jgi:RNA polymerase sigma-70 factor (ECF subfamily)